MAKIATRCHLPNPYSRTLTTPCSCARRCQLTYPSSRRKLHTSRINSQYTPSQPSQPQSRPRWAQTPPLMTAPFRMKPLPENNDFPVNSDPKKLDRMYNRLLGEGGDEMLSEEVKWLAVTHKSFDHGRRGYNDRLSFIGKMIVELQTSLALIHGMTSYKASEQRDPYDRTPYTHIAFEGLGALSETNKREALAQKRLFQLGESCGMPGVLRWKPKKASDVHGSGIGLVTQQAIYAIVGAISMQRGGQVANDVARERILGPMGLYQNSV